MADQSTQTIVIDGSVEDVMDVIADFEAYPDWADAVKTVEILDHDEDGFGTKVTFVIDAGVLRDEYTLQYDWTGYPQALRWSLVQGKMQKSQEGQYSLRANGATTDVTYTLAVDLVVPMIGLMRRKAEKRVMDTALKELKRRVEAG